MRGYRAVVVWLVVAEVVWELVRELVCDVVCVVVWELVSEDVRVVDIVDVCDVVCEEVTLFVGVVVVGDVVAVDVGVDRTHVLKSPPSSTEEIAVLTISTAAGQPLCGVTAMAPLSCTLNLTSWPLPTM